jgi:hypothetical protein
MAGEHSMQRAIRPALYDTVLNLCRVGLRLPPKPELRGCAGIVAVTNSSPRGEQCIAQFFDKVFSPSSWWILSDLGRNPT